MIIKFHDRVRFKAGIHICLPLPFLRFHIFNNLLNGKRVACREIYFSVRLLER